MPIGFSPMLCKTFIMYSLSLIASTKFRKQFVAYKKIELSTIDEVVYDTGKYIDKLIQKCKSVIEKSEKNNETYKVAVQSFLERLDIEFTEQAENFDFTARIPKAVNNDDTSSIIEQTKIQNNRLDPQKSERFQDRIFYKTTEVLAKSSVSALGILIDFASKNLLQSSGNHKACRIVYDPEKPYDAKVILTINWLIKLKKTCYDNSFLYDYQIDITEEDLHYQYNVTFSKKSKHPIESVTANISVGEFIQYYQALPKDDLKELSEIETAEKYLCWANAKNKTELAHCIAKNKDFFNGLFDMIRKARSTLLNLSYCADPRFLETSVDKTMSCAYMLTQSEEDMRNCLMEDQANKKMLVPPTFLDFLYYPDDLTTDLRYMDAIKHGISSLSLTIKYAELCFAAKRYEKLNRLVKKSTNFCKLGKEIRTKFLTVKQNIEESLCLIGTDFSVINTLSVKDLDTKQSFLIRFLDAASLQEIEIIKDLETLRIQEIAADVFDYKQNKTLLRLNRFSSTCNSFLAKINEKYKNSLFYNSDGANKLRELKDKLRESKVALEYLLTITNPDDNTRKRILGLYTKGKELKDVIEFEILWFYRTSENINGLLHKAWKKTCEFFVELKHD